MKTAVAYYIGADPALRRQKDAVQTYATTHKLRLAREFWDSSNESSNRHGFSAMLAYVLGGGAKVALVEKPGYVSPDLAAQLAACLLFMREGVELVAVTEPDYFEKNCDSKVADSVDACLRITSAFEKHSRLARLRKGRDKRSAQLGYRIEGNPSWGRFNPEHVDTARRFAAAGKSLRQISAELAKKGYLNNASKPYGAESVARMLRGDAPGLNVRAGRSKRV
jgi:DNA invertase Pin-like site-specific DNA recombinase